MPKRIYSLETEYALAHAPSEYGASLSTDQVYDRLEGVILAQLPHVPCDPTAARSRASESSPIQICEGHFLANGARLYFDTGHLEWSSPETTSPYEAVVFDRAGETEIAEAAAQVEAQFQKGSLFVVKNNITYRRGITFGCHENYSLHRNSCSGQIVVPHSLKKLVPFLVTRQIFAGAGRLDADCPPFVGFQLSQRADFITRVISLDTRENRPLINLRDEPLADGHTYCRLHLILGDSNLAEHSAFLKLATTGILLDMLENDAELPNVVLVDPIRSLWLVSRDVEFCQKIPLVGGGAMTALEVQRAYWQATRTFVSKTFQEDDSRLQVIKLWGEVLEGIEKRAGWLQYTLDWAIKRRLYGEYLSEQGTTWDELGAWQPVLAHSWDIALPSDHEPNNWRTWLRKSLCANTWEELEALPFFRSLDWQCYRRFRELAGRLRSLDICFHDIKPQRGLFYRHSQARKIVSETEVEAARRRPPADTRAAVRAQAICLSGQKGWEVKMDWDKVCLLNLGQEISLPDPFQHDAPWLRRLDKPFTLEPGTSRQKASKSEDLPSDDDVEITILKIEPLDNKKPGGP